MAEITSALIGGAMLGIAVVGYLYVNGRVAGISGLLAQILNPTTRFFSHSAFWFLLGLVLTPFIYAYYFQPKIVIDSSPLLLVVAGFLVGFGTRLGSGCTSGHGICGVSRLSARSMVATMLFMLSGMVVVFVVRRILEISA